MRDSLDLPAGFRFHPTDEELVNHYLCRKCGGQPISVPVIADVDLYKFDPWQLPGMAPYGEKEWYFFSPRDRKYPNGSRPNRAAGNGYWKATGADKAIGKPRPVGIKKALVFYAGKAQGGVKTDWIMHEYRLANVDRTAAGKRNGSKLDDWVLCRIYNKKGVVEKHCGASEKELGGEIEDRVVNGQSCGDTWRSKKVGSPEGKYCTELESALDFRFDFMDEEVLLPYGSHFCTGEDPLLVINNSRVLQF